MKVTVVGAQFPIISFAWVRLANPNYNVLAKINHLISNYTGSRTDK